MSNLTTFSLLHEKVRKYKKDYSLENESTAFSWLALETIFHLNSNDIEESLTDGPMDGGIDAVYIDDKTVNVVTFKYTSRFELTKNNFPEKDLDSFLVTIQSILGKTLTQKTVNDLIWDKAKEIWELFSIGSLNFKFYICSNKQKPVPQAKKKFETALKEFRFVDFVYIDQEDLVSKILERKYRKVDGQLSFIDKQYFDRSDGNVRGIVATVAASDLVSLVADKAAPEQINEDAFNQCCRHFLR